MNTLIFLTSLIASATHTVGPVGELWTEPIPTVVGTKEGAVTLALLTDEPVSVDEMNKVLERFQGKFPGTSMFIGHYRGTSPSTKKIRLLLGKYGMPFEGEAIILIDDARRIRAVEYSDKVEASGVRAMASEWLTGRKIYNADCARCHGEDGALDDYPNIVRLDGIAGRMDTDAILDATEASGFVNVRSYTKRDRVALASYVLSLYARTSES